MVHVKMFITQYAVTEYISVRRKIDITALVSVQYLSNQREIVVCEASSVNYAGEGFGCVMISVQ